MAGSTESRGIIVATAAAALALCAAGPAFAQRGDGAIPEERRKTETHGPALSGGLGSQYVNLGIQAAYYLQLSNRLFRVAPFVAFGWATFGASEDVDSFVGTGAGAAVSWGRKHRLTVDLFYAPSFGGTSLSLHGEPPQTELDWGPGVAIGYEYAAYSGLFVRTNLGLQYTVTAPILAPGERFVPAGTLIGVGYKLW